MRNKIIILFFCFILLLGLGGSLLYPDRHYSENEKRTLSQLPSLSLSSFISGKFGSKLETYLSDQFPARDSWITVKTLSELALGKREGGKVYFAGDGYLIDCFSGYNAQLCMDNVAFLKQLSDTLQEQLDIPMRVMLVPTAVEILSDKLPAFAPHASQLEVTAYAKKQGLDMVDVSNILSLHKDDYIFYKTDHHYTSLGAYYCYCAWQESRGQQPEELSAWTSEVLCDNFRGTTYSKVNYPFAPYDTITAYYKQENHTVNYNDGNYITDSIYERKYLDSKDQYAVFLNSNQSSTVISGGGNGKLLILKDSYANSFAQFVIDDFEETHLLDLRFFTGSVTDYARMHNITEVLVLYNIPNFSTDTRLK